LIWRASGSATKTSHPVIVLPYPDWDAESATSPHNVFLFAAVDAFAVEALFVRVGFVRSLMTPANRALLNDILRLY
jgi:hypothetical protein